MCKKINVWLLLGLGFTATKVRCCRKMFARCCKIIFQEITRGCLGFSVLAFCLFTSVLV